MATHVAYKTEYDVKANVPQATTYLKQTHTYEQKKGQYHRQREQPTTFHEGKRPCHHLLKKENTCIQAQERTIRPTKGAKSKVVPMRSGPQVGKLATSPLPYRGSPPLQSGGQNQKWPTSGQSGYLTPAISGIPAAAERGAKSEVAHKWANWLPHPCRIGDPRRWRAGGKIRSGPQVGKLATSPLPYRGSPPLQSGGQNQKWPTSGQIGYLSPAVSGIPAAGERGAKSEVAHKWANWLPHPCRIGDPRRCRAGGKIRSGPQVGKLATSPLPYRGSPPLESGGQNQKWPTSGQIGYLTPAVLGIPAASKRGAKSEMSKKRAEMQRHPCIVGGP